MRRERRAELLALADPEELLALADRCLADGVRPTVLVAPEVGCIATEVVDPVAADRFLLGDVLACRAEVELAGTRGWAMRLGDDRAAVLAAAVCDAEAAAGGSATPEVDALCIRVAEREAARSAAEWEALAPTVVAFEELT
ncbi:phosphonate C-P lyase system protein PhnG [Pseudonocardia sp. H11422]|uniref:phosphonate C-P lyase system protein PhnG n=1 Tax=Pseudonocardia sp. H11422 TaxID=2835866 RepID=UPI001BDD8C2C|nr:phosphonate C-P lyase system protein PhnG [Pseudonocardia sp. H11422]